MLTGNDLLKAVQNLPSMAEPTMIIYEVFGWTARIDWSGSSVKKSLGIFASEAGAEAKIAAIKSKDHWYMDWENSFTVETRTIVA